MFTDQKINQNSFKINPMSNFISKRQYKFWRILLVSFLILILLHMQIACRNYFMAKKLDSGKPEFEQKKTELSQLNRKYIIIHMHGERYHLLNIELDQDKLELRANYETASPKHNLYSPDAKQSTRYRSNHGEGVVLNEIHLIGKNFIIDGNKVTIPFQNLERIDIIEKDSGKTVASHVLGAVAVIGGIFALILIIFALTKSSCPFIYIQDGESFVFKGEIYGGAILKPLERDDYMHLSAISAKDTVFKIWITNELKEKQYTDIAELLIATHNPDVKLFITNSGEIHSVQNIYEPLKANLNSEFDYLKQVSSTDSFYCIFNAAGMENNVNELHLQFERPEDVTDAKLIINAKNSLWLDYAYGEMTKLFGASYNKWIDKNQNGDRMKMEKWISEQYFPLAVYIKLDSTWTLVEEIPTIGPLAARDICIPLHLNGNGKKIEVKLVTGFMFWEVDFAGISFDKNTEINYELVKPEIAVDDRNNDVTDLLLNSDEKYLEQPGPGYQTEIMYKLKKKSDNDARTVFLHTRGYYIHIRDHKGLPDLITLNSLKQKGAFVNFSKGLYDSLSKSEGFDKITYKSE